MLENDDGADRVRGAAHRIANHGQTHPLALGVNVRQVLTTVVVDRIVSELTARHDALHPVADQPNEALHSQVRPPETISTRALRAAGQAEAVDKAVAALAMPFDLVNGPLLRALHIEIGPDEHLVVLNAPAAAADRTSLTILAEEFVSRLAGEELPAVPLNWAAFNRRQRAWVRGVQADRCRKFWRTQLTGDLPRLQWEKSESMGSGAERLVVKLAGNVEALAERRGVPVSAVLLAAWAATLYRFTRQDELIIAIPVSQRSGDAANLVGPLTQDLPMRLSLGPDPSFAELLTQVSRAMAEATGHRMLPLTTEMEPFGLDPNIMAMRFTSLIPQETDTIDIRTTSAEQRDLDLVVGPDFKAELTHTVDTLRARQLIESYGVLLTNAAGRPDTPLAGLALVPADRIALRAAQINADAEFYPDLQPIHIPFVESATRAPNLVAVETTNSSITYGELHARSTRLASALSRRGIGPEHMVGICLDRSVDLIVALFGTLKAGAAFVPLDPRMPGDRVSAIAADAGLSLILTDRHDQPGLSAPVPIAVVAQEIATADTDRGLPVVSLDDAAYIYYTSGSTGAPKGVVIDHRCAAGRLEWLVRRYALAPGARVIGKTPLIFDVAVWEIFGTLASGATLLLADPLAESDVTHIRDLLGRPNTVFTHFVPSMLSAYLDHAPPAPYPDLLWVQTSGETVPGRLLAQFAEYFSVDLHNLYGQTETSEVAAWEGRIHDGPMVPIGRQIGIYRLFVMDEHLGIVPPGVPGELCVAGVGGLARGYLGRAAETAERFVPHPHPLVPGERLYRTGDLACMDGNGVLSYLGRIDEQVKIRGVRVETGEVEAVLARHPAVRDCAVLARTDDGAAAELVAYVVGEAIDVADLAAHAERFLTTYLQPLSTSTWTSSRSAHRASSTVGLFPNPLPTTVRHGRPTTASRRDWRVI